MAKMKDITGNKYNKLTAVSSTGGKNKKGNYIWNFICECGNTCEVPLSDVTSGNTQSCGCLVVGPVRHGMCYTTEYKSWSKIMERCFNEKCPEYALYGAVGISAQDSWRDFQNFINHIGLKPQDGNRYTVDRLDNNLGYVEGNVRWATPTQQARNKTFYSNNKSGVIGVYWKLQKHPHSDNTTLYAVANWKSIDCKDRSKFFSVTKYGKEGAFRMACEMRLKMMEELSKAGAGYSENHGKVKNDEK